MSPVSRSFARNHDEGEIAMSLLGEAERVAAREGAEDGEEDLKSHPPGLTPKDKRAMALLIVLYLIQGIPIGLSFGSIPFLLKAQLSYSQIGLFSLCTYPYSLKLLWSPIVDSIYSTRIGRRKSWIVPIQAIIGSLMIWIGRHSEELLTNAEANIQKLTILFTALVFFAATQDIAVDGWALTLLSQQNLSYASTSQTIGLNCGFFLSFTVFLAFNSADFANKWFRTVPSDAPFLSLGTYLTFWGFVCFVVTLLLFFFKKEDPVSEESSELSLTKVYKIMWSICKLKHVQALCLMHLVSKIGFQANDSVTDLKLLEKGLGKEDLALIALIDFPFQLIGGWFAASWAKGKRPLRPWLHAFWVRLVFCVIAMGMVKGFPKTPIPFSFLVFVIMMKTSGSFAGTVQFVGVSAFHTQISDPLVGGTYMTLLNTVSNLGGTWPTFPVLRAVDALTIATCHIQEAGSELVVSASECATESGKSACKDLGGTCVIERDGYYAVSIICVTIGAVLFASFILPTARRLQAVPLAKWRVHTD
ncbi:hypothetical protein BOTBODRAFT_109510 [Botryobasidium botryosum FD-172 SS1]|uniref:Major facilitator superfamily (MFS) profile domain-containing protein n=1 Tax=Botryobasidium botryosum (strain FD-172 SS1) TaxID=930990 RepID=A0A067MSW0_BOTB1|nr:hypothetical protein BOTBODRAFT_109510 [Botryobasidium botryosum FD-172 SS1]